MSIELSPLDLFETITKLADWEYIRFNDNQNYGISNISFAQCLCTQFSSSFFTISFPFPINASQTLHFVENLAFMINYIIK